MITTAEALKLAHTVTTADEATVDAISDGDLAIAILELEDAKMLAETLIKDIDEADESIVTVRDIERQTAAISEVPTLSSAIHALRMERWSRR